MILRSKISSSRIALLSSDSSDESRLRVVGGALATRFFALVKSVGRTRRGHSAAAAGVRFMTTVVPGAEAAQYQQFLGTVGIIVEGVRKSAGMKSAEGIGRWWEIMLASLFRVETMTSTLRVDLVHSRK